jgi:transposase
MIGLSNNEEVYIATKHVDMRKSFDGLAIYVQEFLHKNPLSGKWFVFFNKNHNKVKIFYWDNNGICIWYKRLEDGIFRPPRVAEKVYSINSHELNLLLEGIDLTNKQRLGSVIESRVD